MYKYLVEIYSNFILIVVGNLEKETTFMQKRMIALEPRIEAVSEELEVDYHLIGIFFFNYLIHF